MQYQFGDLLKAEHVLVNVPAVNARDAISLLSTALERTGTVSPGFAEDVWNREQTFPTGLPTQPLAVAIPHADPDHVNHSGICIGALKSPVHFVQMGTDGSTVLEVHVVFLLAIKEKEKQVEMIQQLMRLIQSPRLVDGLSNSGSTSEAVAVITTMLT
ncbi:MAG: PTS sugar transporter subunit IIA [Chloroflexi bacterium]|nr:PTS sugar transporter subunit IIA [Chloroflexota bacterium]